MKTDISKYSPYGIFYYDEKGIPVYHPFEPNKEDIHVLMVIACQHCGQKFAVEYTSKDRTLLEKIRSGNRRIHYGDPPMHGKCVGNYMNCYDLEILQFWFDGKRLTELEGPMKWE